MVDLYIAGPIITLLSSIDVILHLYLDKKKAIVQGKSRFSEPSVQVPSVPLIAVGFSTLLAFVLVGQIQAAWIIEVFLSESWIFFDFAELPFSIWIIGLLLLSLGIITHGWTRYVRQEMAASWMMSEEHRLVTSGPYSRVRHPSYTSYFLCFIGLFLISFSLLSLTSFVGFWGYHRIAVVEEENLLQHFGGAYSEYMKRTGRFFPGL